MSAPQKKQLWGDHLDRKADELNVLFCAGRDVKPLPSADEELIPYDILTNIAHAKMLCSLGVLTEDENAQICAALRELHELYLQNKFSLNKEREDVHANIEFWLVQDKGITAAKKIHSGRSRNDQVATDMRLFMRERLLAYATSCSNLSLALIECAEKLVDCVMPGYTHNRPAMWCSFAYWISSWVEGLLRSVKRFENLLEEINESPLGSAAGFGTSWSVDREMCAKLLGFRAPTRNCLDSIMARTEIEAQCANIYAQLFHQFSNVAQDLILLSHPYYGMIALDDRFVTGSSIMPQKKNPDFAEVIKGKAAFALGIYTALIGLQKGAFSGYNRDVQIGKYMIMDLFREAEHAPEILAEVVRSLKINRDEMLAKCKVGFMNSSDIADWLAKERGLLFRDAYNLIARAVKYSETAGIIQPEALQKAMKEMNVELELSDQDFENFSNPQLCLKLRKHTGSPSSTETSKTLATQKETTLNFLKNFDARRQNIRNAFSALMSE